MNTSSGLLRVGNQCKNMFIYICLYSIGQNMQKHCFVLLKVILVQECRCSSCTYCRENSICGNSSRHTALPRRGKLSQGTLHTCCLLPSSALFVVLQRDVEIMRGAEASGAGLSVCTLETCSVLVYKGRMAMALRMTIAHFHTQFHLQEMIQVEMSLTFVMALDTSLKDTSSVVFDGERGMLFIPMMVQLLFSNVSLINQWVLHSYTYIHISLDLQLKYCWLNCRLNHRSTPKQTKQCKRGRPDQHGRLMPKGMCRGAVPSGHLLSAVAAGHERKQWRRSVRVK